MGVISKALSVLFGGGRNVATEVAGIFRENAERTAARDHEYNSAALAQYAAEFHARQNRTLFDSLVDGLNRLARPLITLTALGVIPAVVIWPEELAVAFSALALLPTGYWALVSIIIGFYYGGRMQIKAQNFERSVTEAAARAPQVIENMRRLRNELSPGEAVDDSPELVTEIVTDLPTTENQAVLDWRRSAA